MKNKALLIAFLIAALVQFAAGQDTKNGEKEMKEIKKAADYSKDHESIDSIIKATYDVISGAKGEQRDWERFRLLFYPDARLVPTRKSPEGVFQAVARTPEEYIETSGPILLKNGFYEEEIARKTEAFGNIAHVFSTYEARNSLSDEKPFLRGINSFQLINDGQRWWVLTIYWQAETPDSKIPEKYLKAGN